MKVSSVFLANAFVYFASFGVFTILAILLPELAREEKASNPNVSSALPYLLGAWVLAIPVFIALFQAHKLIGLVAREEALSAKSIIALRNIKLCAIAFGILFFLAAATAIAVIKLASPTEDTAPFGVFIAAVGLSSAIVATSAAVLQRLVENAMQIKQENDLTV